MTEAHPNNPANFRVCVIKTDLKEINIPQDAILAELRRHQYGDDAIFAIRLALDEALVNAVKHGNRSDANKTVTVRYAVDAEQVEVIVRDEGTGFLPESVPDCTSAERLPVPSGRGIMLMRAYVDEICFSDQGREVYFMRRRDSQRMCGCYEDDNSGADTKLRRTFLYSGNVQGVGFRYTARGIAEQFDVTGYVKNLDDGRVEIVAEGDLTELDKLQSVVADAMRVHIRDVAVTDSPATGEFQSFRVAH